MRVFIVFPLIALLLVTPAAAAGASNALNYQGVLRDENGTPRNGTFDMRFRFFDAATLGNELLINEHLAAGSGGVVVTGGLFNVALGEGLSFDGSGPGSYLSVSDVVSNNYDVWLEIQVGGETLTPRVALRSSAYAMNASRLQGMESSAFLNTSAAPQQKTGLIIASGGVDFGAGTNDDLTSADVTTLTGGGNADALHTHSMVSNANMLDSIDSSQFLRSDTSDTFTSGVLTMAAPTVLDVKGTLQLNGSLVMDADGPDGAQAIYFYNSGQPTNASIQWDDTNNRFYTSHGLYVDGVLRSNQGAVIGGSQVTVGSNGPDQDQILAFYEDGNPQGEYLEWDNTGDQFFLSDDVHIGGNTTVNGSSLSMGGLGAETSQSIFFFNGGSSTGESIVWDDAQDRFEVSDELAISGVLRTGSALSAPVVYNTIGSGTPASGDMNASTDLFVSGDLEVAGQIYVGSGAFISEYGGGGSVLISGSAVTQGGLSLLGNRIFFDWDESGNAWIDYDDPDPQFTMTRGLDITGTLSADVKNFVQNHPTDKGLSIVYTTLEGPEASVFTRGSARLENGVATVKLDETFAWVAHPDLGLTATLTPKGDWSNLYVASVTPTELVVRGTADAKPDAAFDYLVMGLRVGYEESAVVRPKTREATLPRVEDQRAAIASRPDLAKYTPLAKYQQISRDVTGQVVEDLSKGAALRSAIGVAEAVPGRSTDGLNAPKAASPEVDQPADRETVVQAAMRKAPAPADEDAPAVAATPRTSFEDAEGNLHARSFRPNAGGLDGVSPVIGEVAPGDVLAIDPSGRGVRRADLSEDVAVVGIATGAPATGRDGVLKVPFAVAGIVPCHVDASRGPIRPGDLLVSSPEPGHAMRATSPAPGTMLGKALEELPAGTGTIRVLVVLR